MKCGDCKFWVRIGMEATGECRRYPPTVLNDFAVEYSYEGAPYTAPNGSWTTFPDISESAWCGEYQPSDIAKRDRERKE